MTDGRLSGAELTIADMSTPKPIFDAAGIPLDGVDEFWRGVVRELFVSLNRDGWDLPSALFALMTPAASEAAFFAQTGLTVEEFRREYTTDSDAPALYQFSLVRASYEHPRSWLPLLELPPGVGAVALVTEAWQSQLAVESAARGDFTVRPSESPDRVEIRQATVVTADGSMRMYRHERGTDLDSEDGLVVFVDDGESDHLRGMLPILTRRCLGLPVDPEVAVPSVLGRMVLLQIVDALRKNPNPKDAPVVALTTALLVIGGIQKALAVAPGPGQRDIVLMEGVENMADLLGLLESSWVARAREISGWSWGDFFSQPGGRRWWLADVQEDTAAWYGPEMLGILLDERLPAWDDLFAEVSESGGREALDAAQTALQLACWGSSEP